MDDARRRDDGPAAPGDRPATSPAIAPRRRFPWRTAGLVTAGVLATCGLVVLALALAFATALSSWASNK